MPMGAFNFSWREERRKKAPKNGPQPTRKKNHRFK